MLASSFRIGKNHNTSQSTVDHKNALKGGVHKASGINLIRLAFLGLALLPLSIYAAISNTELPTGANITQGSANISQNGNVLNIHQNSQTFRPTGILLILVKMQRLILINKTSHL